MINAAILAIPLWVVIGAGIIVFFLQRPFASSDLVALAVACIAELLLIGHAWRLQGWRLGPSQVRAAAGALAPASVRRSTPVRRMGLLAVLAGAYLHYYYWDVQAQITALPAVTVFVPVPGIG